MSKVGPPQAIADAAPTAYWKPLCTVFISRLALACPPEPLLHTFGRSNGAFHLGGPRASFTLHPLAISGGGHIRLTIAPSRAVPV